MAASWWKPPQPKARDCWIIKTNREVQGKSFIEQDVETFTFSRDDQVINPRRRIENISNLWNHTSPVLSPEIEKERKKGEVILAAAGDDTLTQTLIHN